MIFTPLNLTDIQKWKAACHAGKWKIYTVSLLNIYLINFLHRFRISTPLRQE